MESVRDLLKSETAELHKKIENAFSVLSPDFTLNNYFWLLSQFYGFYRPLEHKISLQNLPEQLDWSNRKKVPLLQKDIRHFNINEDAITYATLSELPPVNTMGETMGVLYVIEGSTLGGQVITKSLKEKFALSSEDGTSFYNCYGQQTGKMWRQFITCLDAYVTEPQQVQDAVKAAKSTFSALGDWMQKPQP